MCLKIVYIIDVNILYNVEYKITRHNCNGMSAREKMGSALESTTLAVPTPELFNVLQCIISLRSLFTRFSIGFALYRFIQ